MSKLYTEQQVKLIATRFAKELRDNQDVTSNDTIIHYEKFIETFDAGKIITEEEIREDEKNIFRGIEY